MPKNKGAEDNNEEVGSLVMAGLEQIKEGKAKDFDNVCDRPKLKQRFRNEAVSN